MVKAWAETVNPEGESLGKTQINSAREILGLSPIDFSDSSLQQKGSREKKAKKKKAGSTGS